MNSMLGWILALGGAYIVYTKFLSHPDTTDTGGSINPGTTPTQNENGDTQVSVTSNTTSPGTVVVAPYAGTYAGNSMAIIQKWGAWVSAHPTPEITGNNLNTDQWNWYFTQATGLEGIAPEQMGISPRNATMTYASYSNMVARYLNNVLSISGMGRLAEANYFKQNPSSRDYRSAGLNRPTATPTGFEKMNKRIM